MVAGVERSLPGKEKNLEKEINMMVLQDVLISLFESC